jgi:hypothetical protein
VTTATGEPDRLVDRIGKLLAQAEGTDNEHEAAAFVERAQQLATLHAIDLERARQQQRAQHRRADDDPLQQERLDVGPRGRRGNRHRVLLYVAVARANDVLVNVATDSTYVLGFGHQADLDVVEQLWSSLAVQMAAAAQRRLDAGEHRASRVAATTWRLSFYDGFTHTVAQRLQSAREHALAREAQNVRDVARQRGERSAEPGAQSGALVLRQKADRVQEFYSGTSQARGSWRGTATGRTAVSHAARRAGHTDGAAADLGQPRLRSQPQLDR